MTLKQYLQSKTVSKTITVLVEKLKQFSSEDDYIIGILVDVETDEERQLLIDYIDNGEDVTYESVILFALDINLQRKKQ
jgi:hypothetical protein